MIFWVVLIVTLVPTAVKFRAEPIGFTDKINMSCMKPTKMFVMPVMISDEITAWIPRHAMIVTARAQTMHWDRTGWIGTAPYFMGMNQRIRVRTATNSVRIVRRVILTKPAAKPQLGPDGITGIMMLTKISKMTNRYAINATI